MANESQEEDFVQLVCREAQDAITQLQQIVIEVEQKHGDFALADRLQELTGRLQHLAFEGRLQRRHSATEANDS